MPSKQKCTRTSVSRFRVKFRSTPSASSLAASSPSTRWAASEMPAFHHMQDPFNLSRSVAGRDVPVPECPPCICSGVGGTFWEVGNKSRGGGQRKANMVSPIQPTYEACRDSSARDHGTGNSAPRDARMVRPAVGVPRTGVNDLSFWGFGAVFRLARCGVKLGGLGAGSDG